MWTRTLPPEDYWTTLARVLPEFSPEQQHSAVTIYRELAKGKPLTTERVASVLGVPSEKAAEELGLRLVRKQFGLERERLSAVRAGVAGRPK